MDRIPDKRFIKGTNSPSVNRLGQRDIIRNRRWGCKGMVKKMLFALSVRMASRESYTKKSAVSRWRPGEGLTKDSTNPCADDTEEILRLQTCPPDERAIDVRLAQEVAGIVRLDAAAVLDDEAMCSRFAAQLADALADECMG